MLSFVDISLYCTRGIECGFFILEHAELFSSVRKFSSDVSLWYGFSVSVLNVHFRIECSAAHVDLVRLIRLQLRCNHDQHNGLHIWNLMNITAKLLVSKVNVIAFSNVQCFALVYNVNNSFCHSEARFSKSTSYLPPPNLHLTYSKHSLLPFFFFRLPKKRFSPY